ncbi:MAG: DNA-methyltransferase [Promethearchaeota archaeon]
MKTTHKIFFQPAQQMDKVKDASIGLVITSPPYPMIEMWDDVFAKQNNEIKEALDNEDGNLAFDLMHKELDKVWKEVKRVLIPGGIACINIGDATRTIGNIFKLYPSHARIISSFLKLGFQSLPEILWRKQTNAPNKFMGSGMLPPGAYVTLEHEFILIFRKGNKRDFKKADLKENRRNSSYFWEERNIWFSDLWNFKGISQKLLNGKARERSAAFPFELAYRLICMFSVKNDIVLDPFVGTGTTSLAAMTLGRNSIGIDVDEKMGDIFAEKLKKIVNFSNKYIKNRINNHLQFIYDRIEEKGPTKYNNEIYGFPVITNQEKFMKFNLLKEIVKIQHLQYEVQYSDENFINIIKKEREISTPII